jgi:hypothetical protein
MENKKGALAKPSLPGVANLKVRFSAKAYNVRQQSRRASGLLPATLRSRLKACARNDGLFA